MSDDALLDVAADVLLREAKEARYNGLYGMAMDYLSAADVVNRTNRTVESVELMLERGCLYVRLGRLREAASLLGPLLALPNDRDLFIRCRLAVTRLYRVRRDFIRARQVLESLGNFHGIDIDYEWGMIWKSVQGRAHLAIPYFMKCLDCTKDDTDSDEYVKYMRELGRCKVLTGDVADGTELQRRAWRISEQMLGKTNRNTVACMSSLADAYRTQRRYAEAVSLFADAMAIDEGLSGEGDGDFAILLTDAANCYLSMGQDALALPLIVRARRIQKRCWDADHPRHVDCLALLYAMKPEAKG